MLAVAVLLGLVVGGAFGLSSRNAGANANAGSRSSGAGETTSSSEPPQTFWTVILSSPTSEAKRDRDEARARANGVTDLWVASQDQYTPLGTPFAVCSGHFPTEAEAKARAQDLLPSKIAGPPYTKKLNRL
jgi:septal ring-binding cell division protein DamX